MKEKITVAVTAALSGAVMLGSINSQLGNIGYTIAVEYAFYVYFALSTLAIIAVLAAERLRGAGRAPMAAVAERSIRVMFMVSVAAVVAGGVWLGSVAR